MPEVETKPRTLTAGAIFHERYEIVRRIKEGGMGAVYEVLDRKTRRRRALKVMLPALVKDPDLHKRFKLEAVITADIESEHIVETFDADVDAETGSPFIVMELLKGEDLGALLEQRGRFGTSEALVLLYQASLALDRTHAAGIVHRDLKPENLFLSRSDDGAPKLKVLDFGIAKVVESARDAKTTRTLGTPLYMSPEQIQGDGAIGARSDIYALGHIAYALLVGEAYFTQESNSMPSLYAMLAKVLQGPAEPPSTRAARREVSLRPDFDAWFGIATAIDPQARFGSAGALVAALAEALGQPLARSSAMGWSPTDVASALSTRAVIVSPEATPALRSEPFSLLSASDRSTALSAPDAAEVSNRATPSLPEPTAVLSPPTESAPDMHGTAAAISRTLTKLPMRSPLPWVIGAGLVGLAGVGGWGVFRLAVPRATARSTAAPPSANAPSAAVVAGANAAASGATTPPTIIPAAASASPGSSPARAEPTESSTAADSARRKPIRAESRPAGRSRSGEPHAASAVADKPSAEPKPGGAPPEPPTAPPSVADPTETR